MATLAKAEKAEILEKSLKRNFNNDEHQSEGSN